MRNSFRTGPGLHVAGLALLLVVLAACTSASRPEITGMSFTSEPLVGKMIWHDLITEDAAAAQQFYGGLFGWTFEASAGARGDDYLLARNGDVYVAGMLGIDASEDGEKYSRWLPYISVEDVDAAVARSTAAGGTVAASPRKLNIGWAAAIVDPEGAVIGLASSSIGDPDDSTTAPAPGRPVWTELLANDPGAASRFYTALANYSSRSIARRGGEYTVLSGSGADRAGILQNPAEDSEEALWLTAFGVEDPAAAAAKAVSLGGTIILPVSPELRDGTTAVVTDPTGAILVLQSWSRNGAES